MRKFTWVEPGETGEPTYKVISDKEILRTYYPWWSRRMYTLDRAALVNLENCIEDFCTVHWASEIPNHGIVKGD